MEKRTKHGDSVLVKKTEITTKAGKAIDYKEIWVSAVAISDETKYGGINVQYANGVRESLATRQLWMVRK